MFIGVDIGTTHVKAVAFSQARGWGAQAVRGNETLSPRPGWSEQEPEAVFQCVEAVLVEVIEAHYATGINEPVESVAFSSAMHGLTAVDEQGRPLTRFWLWSDLRAAAQAREREGRALYPFTGVPLHPMSPLCKIRWMRENLPDVFHKTRYFLGIKEYVWYRLTGTYMSDYSCASATGLLNIFTRNYHLPALEWAGIGEERLLQPVSTGKSGEYRGTNAQLLKYLGGASLVIGAGDGALANLGSGAVHPGQVAVTIGTSAAIRCVSREPKIDPLMRTFCYFMDDGRYIAGGASNNGANALEWLRREVFDSPLSPEAFARLAEEAPPGSEGLIFVPYLQGERAPVWDPEARGAFLGLTSRHRQAHFVRAVMEGILYNLKLIASVMDTPIHSLHASGGFTRSEGWVQMLADIFQQPVFVQEEGVDASVMGALYMAGAKLDEFLSEPGLIQPDQINSSVYDLRMADFQVLGAQHKEGLH